MWWGWGVGQGAEDAGKCLLSTLWMVFKNFDHDNFSGFANENANELMLHGSTNQNTQKKWVFLSWWLRLFILMISCKTKHRFIFFLYKLYPWGSSCAPFGSIWRLVLVLIPSGVNVGIFCARVVERKGELQLTFFGPMPWYISSHSIKNGLKWMDLSTCRNMTEVYGVWICFNKLVWETHSHYWVNGVHLTFILHVKAVMKKIQNLARRNINTHIAYADLEWLEPEYGLTPDKKAFGFHWINRTFCSCQSFSCPNSCAVNVCPSKCEL